MNWCVPSNFILSFTKQPSWLPSHYVYIYICNSTLTLFQASETKQNNDTQNVFKQRIFTKYLCLASKTQWNYRNKIGKIQTKDQLVKKNIICHSPHHPLNCFSFILAGSIHHWPSANNFTTTTFVFRVWSRRFVEGFN